MSLLYECLNTMIAGTFSNNITTVENVILLVTFPKLTHNSLKINNLFSVTRIHLTRTFGSPMCSQTLITTLT